MISLSDFLKENLFEEFEQSNIIEEGKIKSEEDFRAAAKKKFEAVFGDDLDEDEMNKTIDGLLKDNKELVDDGKWGELIGILNNSF